MNSKLFLVLFFLMSFAYCQKLSDEIWHAIKVNDENNNQKSLEGLYHIEKKFFLSNKKKNEEEFVALINLYANLGYYEEIYNKVLKSSEAYEKAWILYQNNPDLKDFEVSKLVLLTLGNNYTKLGNYNQAENIILAYKYQAEQDNDLLNYSSAVNNLSIVYNHSNRSIKALKILQKTFKQNKIHPEKKDLLLFQLAETYFNLNQFEGAKNILNALPKETKVHQLFSKIHYEEGKYEEALKKINAVLTLTENQNFTKREISKIKLLKAKILFKQSQINRAKYIISDIFKTLSSSYNTKNLIPKNKDLYLENTFLEALDLLAEIYYHEKDYHQALVCYKKAYDLNNKLSLNIKYEQSTLQSNAENRLRLEQMLNLYFSQNKTLKKDIVRESLLLHEQTKQLFFKSQHQLKKSEKEKKLSSQLQEYNYLLGVQTDDVLKKQLIDKQNKVFFELKKISKNQNTHKDSLDICQIQKTLKSQKAEIFQFFYGVNRLYIWQINANEITLKYIEVSKIDKPLKNYLKLFENPSAIENNLDAYQTLANQLYKLLNIETKYKNLIIIPDGQLNQLSFETLLTKAEKKKKFSDMPFLVLEKTIAYQHALSDLKPLVNVKNKKDILGIFPYFNNTDRQLPFSKQELQSIKKYKKGLFLESEMANFNNFTKQYNQFEILHFSTHAFVVDSLNDAKISFIDEDISFKKLYALNMKPNLVYLSACETGIGKTYAGEGNMSIARGFKYAGAENMIFTLWKSNDLTSSELTKSFYRLLKKINYAFALKQTKVNYLSSKDISENKKSPYYWGANVYYGALEEDSFLSKELIIVFALIFLVLMLFLYKKNTPKRTC